MSHWADPPNAQPRTIYYLHTEHNETPFYVGQTTSPGRRLYEHRCRIGRDSFNPAYKKLMGDLYEGNVIIHMKAITIVEWYDASYTEQACIRLFRARGHRLVNNA